MKTTQFPARPRPDVARAISVTIPVVAYLKMHTVCTSRALARARARVLVRARAYHRMCSVFRVYHSRCTSRAPAQRREPNRNKRTTIVSAPGRGAPRPLRLLRLQLAPSMTPSNTQLRRNAFAHALCRQFILASVHPPPSAMAAKAAAAPAPKKKAKKAKPAAKK